MARDILGKGRDNCHSAHQYLLIVGKKGRYKGMLTISSLIYILAKYSGVNFSLHVPPLSADICCAGGKNSLCWRKRKGGY